MPKTTPTTSDVRHGVEIPLAALQAHPRNYRKHPRKQIMRLRESLRRFGQVKSIVVQEGAPDTYLIAAGHGVTEAAREEGYLTLFADIIPASWTPEQVEGYLIADNMGGADDDQLMLVEMLQEQAESGAKLESMGFSQEELDDLIASLSDDDGDGDVPGEDDEGKPYQSQYAVSVMCASESEQEEVFNTLSQMGYTCKILVV